MNDKVKVMIKNVVEENAVGFKSSTATALYQKISNRLKEEYKNTAKTLFKKKDNLKEEVSMLASDSAAIASPEAAITSAVAPPASDRRSIPSVPVFPDRSKEPWKSMTNKEFKQAIQDYRDQMRAFQEWYRRQKEEELERIREKVHPAERRKN